MSSLLISILPLLGIVVGATLQFLLSRTQEANRQRQNLRITAYVDYLRGVTTTGQAQKRGDNAEEAKGNALMADAKARICVYGADDTLRALAEFSRAGAKLSARQGADAFLALCEAMRREMRGKGVSRDDIARVLFGFELKDFALRGELLAAEPETDGLS
jgi:hypothetical protein